MSIAWSISKIEKKKMHSFMHLLLFFYFKLYLNIRAVNKFIHVLLWKRILPFILNSGIPKMQLFVAIVNLLTFVAKRFIINVVVGFFRQEQEESFGCFFFQFSGITFTNLSTTIQILKIRTSVCEMFWSLT